MPIFILRGLQVYYVPVCVLQARHSKFWPVLYFIVPQTLLSCTRVEKVMTSCFPTETSRLYWPYFLLNLAKLCTQ